MAKTEQPTVRTFSTNNGLVEERRRQITEATLHLIATRGIQKTGIREIAAASNMTIGNLYHYIGTREDIIRLAFNHGMDLAHRLLKELNELYETLGPEQALKEAIDRYIRYHHVNWEGTVFIYKEMGTMAPSLRLPLVELNSHMHELFTRIINKGCKAGVFSTADSELTAGTIVSMGDMWALKRWYFKKNYSLEKYIHSVTAMIYNLVSAEADTVDSQ